MHKRIRELAEQANVLENDFYDNESELKKFAELIIKECVDQASIGNGHGNNQWDRALTFAANNIKDHFGVEGADDES